MAQGDILIIYHSVTNYSKTKCLKPQFIITFHSYGIDELRWWGGEEAQGPMQLK